MNRLVIMEDFRAMSGNCLILISSVICNFVMWDTKRAKNEGCSDKISVFDWNLISPKGQWKKKTLKPQAWIKNTSTPFEHFYFFISFTDWVKTFFSARVRHCEHLSIFREEYEPVVRLNASETAALFSCSSFWNDFDWTLSVLMQELFRSEVTLFNTQTHWADFHLEFI